MSILESLPSSLQKQLKERGETTKWLFAAQTDLNMDGEYADGYIVLGNNCVAYAIAQGKKIRPQYYKGTQTLQERKRRDEQIYTVQFIAMEDIQELEMIKQIGCSVLLAKLEEDEKELRLAYITNLEVGNIRQLVKLFTKQKNGEEIKEEEWKADKEEEYCPKCGQMYPDNNRKVCPKCLDKKSVFIRTMSYFFPFKKELIGTFICIMATALLNLAWPYLNGTVLYDKVLAKDEQFLQMLNLPVGKAATALSLVVLTMIMTKVLMQVVGILHRVFTAKIVPNVVKNLKNDVFESMSKLSVKFYNSKQTGGLMTRVMDDADEVSSFFIDGLPYMFSHIFSFVAVAVIMLRMNWVMALPVLIILPGVVWISSRLMPKFWNLYAARHRARRSLNGKVHDNLTGARVIKAFGQEQREVAKFDRYNVRMMNAEVAVVRFDNIFSILYTIAENMASLFIWGLGGFFMFYYGNISLGMLITFTSYVAQLKEPLDFLAGSFSWWAESMNSAQRIFEIIDSVPDLTEAEEPVRLKEVKGDIELSHVTFAYDQNRNILKDVNLHIEHGKMLGIVGRSGAGKTTLVNLISRLYDPQQGEIYLDGINVKEIAFDDLRRNVAMVSQETYIFMGSILDNIAYANPDATREEVVQAAVLASAHDFICKLPDGYDTIVGSRGRDLSGGEKQRISIARAILANPKILILDEATASVDTETEKAIQQSINYLIQGRTTISIAHRLSTLRDADHLVVMEDGRITEEGTSKELMEKKGTYYKLRELQTKALAMRGVE